MTIENEIQYFKIDTLHLDPLNPRLPSVLQGSSEKELLEYIAKTTAIEDLMTAIAENGYFPGEPVVAYNDAGRLIVIEGNRRLTAVKLLSNTRLIEKPSKRMQDIVQNAQHKPSEIPVVVRATREEVLPYLGFRHITGVKQWEPLAKARYIKQLWDRTPLPSTRERYKEVAQMIGSRANHVKRSLDALAVYEVIEKNDFFQIDGLDGESIKFAVLSTALADEPISNFTGVSERDDTGNPRDKDPVTDDSVLNPENIELLTRWLFERDSSGKAKVAESREIRKLVHVIDNSRALEAFKGGSSLSYAYRLTTGADEEFLQLLYQAQETVEQAAGMVANIQKDFETAMDIARDIKNNAHLIGTALKSKISNQDDF